MEGSIRFRRQKEEKDKLMEGSIRLRRQKEDKEIDMTEGSMRLRRQKEEKDGDVERSERRRQRVADKDRSGEFLKKSRDERENDGKEKAKDGRNKLMSGEGSERRKKKGGDSLRRRVKRFASSLRQKRKQNNEMMEKINTKEKLKRDCSTPTEAQKAVFESFVKEVFEMGVEGLIKEYALLKPYLAASYAREIFDQNPTKNRYKDVICNDLTRVSIKDGKGCDYIHANYVRGDYLQNTFICTQGPIMATIYDFWRMVMSEHVTHIVMLCETVEQGKMKCEQYWPAVQGEKLCVEEFVLTNIRMNFNDNHVTRTTIEIQRGNGGPRHLVKHHQWKTWPDKTVPKSLLAVFRILHVVRSSSNPIVVHCSAGIGRTGSLVAIEMCLQTLLAGQKLSMLETCKRLRDQRMHSVQVEVQYVYVAEALCEYGKAMGFWSSPELLSQYAKFKSMFDEYVSRLPVACGPAPQQDVLSPILQNQPDLQAGLQQSPCQAPMPIAAPQQIVAQIPPSGIPERNVEPCPLPPLIAAPPPSMLQAAPSPVLMARTVPPPPATPQMAPRPPSVQCSVPAPPRTQQAVTCQPIRIQQAVPAQPRQPQSIQRQPCVPCPLPPVLAPQCRAVQQCGHSPPKPSVLCAAPRAVNDCPPLQRYKNIRNSAVMRDDCARPRVQNSVYVNMNAR